MSNELYSESTLCICSFSTNSSSGAADCGAFLGWVNNLAILIPVPTPCCMAAKIFSARSACRF